MKILRFLVVGLAISIICTSPTLAEKPVVYVTNVDELYTAVNDPANAGKVVQLEPGTYLLDPSKGNNGQLRLQERMDLVGRNQYVDHDGDKVWDPISEDPPLPPERANFVVGGSDAETIIDAQNMAPGTPFFDAISAGQDNKIENLTVKNGEVLIGASLGHVSVINCLLDYDLPEPRFPFGVACFNPEGEEGDNAETRCTLTGNIIRNQGEGIFLENAFVQGAKVVAQIRHNRVSYNDDGLFARNVAGASNSEIKVLSTGNIYSWNSDEANVMVAGWNAANSNQFTLTSVKDALVNNQRGVLLFAGLFADSNRVRAEYLGTTFADNRRPTSADMAVAGVPLCCGGSDNKVELLVRNATVDNSDGSPGVFLFIHGGLERGNEVKIIGSNVAFEKANEGVIAPELEGWNPR